MQELWGYPHVEWIVRPKPRTTLGLRGLVWVERFFAWNLSVCSIFQSTALLCATTSDWFSWGIYQTVRLESMTKFGSTRIASRIDKAIGCNWTLETPKGESIETYSTFWRIQVCKQIAKLLCLQTGRVATCKGMRWCLFSCCNSIFQWLLTCAACCLLASSITLQQS